MVCQMDFRPTNNRQVEGGGKKSFPSAGITNGFKEAKVVNSTDFL